VASFAVFAVGHICGVSQSHDSANEPTVWSGRSAPISVTTDMIAILCIVDEAGADDVVDIVLSVVSDRIGFVAISDVYVVIPEHFRV